MKTMKRIAVKRIMPVFLVACVLGASFLYAGDSFFAPPDYGIVTPNFIDDDIPTTK